VGYTQYVMSVIYANYANNCNKEESKERLKRGFSYSKQKIYLKN